MRDASAPASREDCQRCHTPLWSAPGAPNDEGVNCDGCHTITEVALDERAAIVERDLGSQTKYASLCDPQKVYFHRAACASLFEQSLLCAGCHRWYAEAADGAGEPLPVFTTYDEWRESAYPERGISCQTCHMSSWSGEAARGWARRDGLSSHEFIGDRVAMLAEAIMLDAVVAPAEDPDAQVIEVKLTNVGAGHALPAGLPGRRLRLRVSTLDGEGRVLARRELQYGRALVDEQGAPAAFIRARAVADDQRLYPESPRLERLEFTGDERGARARVELEFLELDPAIEAALELAPVAPQLIARSELALDGRRRGRAR